MQYALVDYTAYLPHQLSATVPTIVLWLIKLALCCTWKQLTAYYPIPCFRTVTTIYLIIFTPFATVLPSIFHTNHYIFYSLLLHISSLNLLPATVFHLSPATVYTASVIFLTAAIPFSFSILCHAPWLGAHLKPFSFKTLLVSSSGFSSNKI